MNTPTIALILSTFNQPEYLTRILVAISRQSQLPNEVILADDGSDDETRQLFSNWAKNQSIRTGHVWQKNEGFRKSRILNQAVIKTESDFLVFLDGDTVPHPDFVKDHARLAAAGCFTQGHRVLVQKDGAVDFGKGSFPMDRLKALFCFQLRGVLNAFHWPHPSRTFRNDLRGIRGCNLGIWRADFVRVNGYNEAFTGWGREDAELALRLMNSGVRRRDARGWALCFHLWHPSASRAELPANDHLLAIAQAEKRKWCDAGLSQPASTFSKTGNATAK